MRSSARCKDTSATKGAPSEGMSAPGKGWKTGAHGRTGPTPPSSSGPVPMGTGPSMENHEARKTPPLVSGRTPDPLAFTSPLSFTSRSRGTCSGSSQRSKTAASETSVSHVTGEDVLLGAVAESRAASARVSGGGTVSASTTGDRSAKASPRQRTPSMPAGGRKARRSVRPQQRAHRILMRRGTSRQSGARRSWRAWRREGSKRSESGSDPNTS
mmetsp:Transcript_105638/g.315537  ORF Transcript_105638/g.315537 Transcript_105638/m.315537 type:complete len:214 (-) Transcript_105638:398-1039(-)